jgi:hypothetical protein
VFTDSYVSITFFFFRLSLMLIMPYFWLYSTSGFADFLSWSCIWETQKSSICDILYLPNFSFTKLAYFQGASDIWANWQGRLGVLLWGILWSNNVGSPVPYTNTFSLACCNSRVLCLEKLDSVIRPSQVVLCHSTLRYEKCGIVLLCCWPATQE